MTGKQGVDVGVCVSVSACEKVMRHEGNIWISIGHLLCITAQVSISLSLLWIRDWKKDILDWIGLSTGTAG